MANSQTNMSLPPSAPTFVTVAQMQNILGIGRATAYELLMTGQVPYIRVGRAIRIDYADLMAWIKKQKGNAGASGVKRGIN